MYTADLLCLDLCRPLTSRCWELLQSVQSPLSPDAWSKALSSHPDRAYAGYITNGLRQGFRIGFNYSCTLRSASSNMASASHHPHVVEEYLTKELALSRMLGPFSGELGSTLQGH